MTASELGSRAVDPPPWTKWQPCYRSTPINGPTLGLVAEWRSVPKAAVSNCKKIDLYTKAPVTRLVIISCLSIRVLPDVAPVSWTPQYYRRRRPQAGLPARHGIAPIRLLNVTRGWQHDDAI